MTSEQLRELWRQPHSIRHELVDNAIADLDDEERVKYKANLTRYIEVVLGEVLLLAGSQEDAAA